MIAELIDPAMLGFILVGVMLFAIFVGFPISFTLIFLGFVFGYLGFGKLVFYLMTLQFSMVMTEQTLAAVPLFVFMGIMMEQAGLMERLFSAFQLMLSKVRGSLYYAVLFVSVIFAAATGIVGASVTILGIMAAKSMNRSGYDVRLAAGTIIITIGTHSKGQPNKKIITIIIAKIKYLFISKPKRNSVNNVGVPNLANTAPKKFEAATKTIIKAVISKVFTSASCNLGSVNFL